MGLKYEPALEPLHISVKKFPESSTLSQVHQSAVVCMAADTRQFVYTGSVDHDICKWYH